MEKNIILIGFMGCGKTTTGKKLAAKLNIPFIDSDHEIEQETNLSISELFHQHGENHFRALEMTFIQSLATRQPFVLSTGGGTPCFNQNMELLNTLGLTIYLKRSPKELTQRLVNAKIERPLIKGKSQAEILEFIEATLEVRELQYSQAHLIVNREEQQISHLLDLIQAHPNLPED
jgi:shikimate kinase